MLDVEVIAAHLFSERLTDPVRPQPYRRLLADQTTALRLRSAAIVAGRFIGSSRVSLPLDNHLN